MQSAMNATPLWFERKFDFSIPVELYPNVIMRLRGTPARMEELLHKRAPEVLRGKSGDGGWSPQENAGHLLDMEPLWLARIEDFVSERGALTAADLTNRKTHEANHNARATEDILSAFRAARFQLCERVQELPADFFSRSLVHPRLKQAMRLVDHLYFVAEHDDHHLARIWELTSPFPSRS